MQVVHAHERLGLHRLSPVSLSPLTYFTNTVYQESEYNKIPCKETTRKNSHHKLHYQPRMPYLQRKGYIFYLTQECHSAKHIFNITVITSPEEWKVKTLLLIYFLISVFVNRIWWRYNCWLIKKIKYSKKKEIGNNISSVVEFQRWWVLKGKIFAQETMSSKEIWIPTTLNYLWSSVVGVVKVDYFDFPCEIFEILCELDVRVIACNF